VAVTTTQTIVVGGRAQAPLALSRQLVGRGMAALVTGLVVLLWPSTRLFVVTLLLAAGAFAVGVAEIVDAAKRRRMGEDWTFEVVRGVLAAGVGLYLFADPNLELAVVARVLGLVWVLYGSVDVVEGLRSRRGPRDGRWRMARGLLTVVAGAVMALWPDITVTVLARTMGALLVVSGLFCFLSARALREAGRTQRDVRLDVVDLS
jgi:uncharacterized membrane protein HdeD (DUF308 family)